MVLGRGITTLSNKHLFEKCSLHLFTFCVREVIWQPLCTRIDVNISTRIGFGRIPFLFFNFSFKSPYFSIERFHWLQSNLKSREIPKPHRTVHVPIGCYFTFQIPHFPRCNIPAISLFVSARRLSLSLRIKSLICLHRLIRSRVNTSRRLVAVVL